MFAKHYDYCIFLVTSYLLNSQALIQLVRLYRYAKLWPASLLKLPQVFGMCNIWVILRRNIIKPRPAQFFHIQSFQIRCHQMKCKFVFLSFVPKNLSNDIISGIFDCKKVDQDLFYHKDIYMYYISSQNDPNITHTKNHL
jgi:hypothetical protein